MNLAGAFNRFRPFRALVIGDFLLDTYTTGRVKRISPEAPVQVLEVQAQESRPGGAGNALLNLISLGGTVTAFGRIGADKEGSTLRDTLLEAGADVRALLVEPGYQTPVKNRLIADSQQLLRVDFEKFSNVDAAIEASAIALLKEMIPSMQAVAISDYGKGFLSNRLIAACVAIAARAKVPCVIDPKGIDFTKYRGATLLKPNLGEAYAAAKMPLTASLEAVARQIFKTAEVERLLITRSEAGMSLFDRFGNRSDFPVRSREVKDVTGAGDTVLAMLCLCLSNGLDLSLAAQFANIAAGIAIERIGCAQVRLSEIAERLLETDCHNKIFDENQSYALQQMLKDKRYSLLVMERPQSVTGTLLRTIRNLGEQRGRGWVLYICDTQPMDEFLQVLSSLHEVKAIILQKKSLKVLCEAICPDEVLFLHGEQIREAKDLLALLMGSANASC